MGDPSLIQILRRPPDPSAPSQKHEPMQWQPVIDRLREYGAVRGERSTEERCEFCGASMAPDHQHLVNVVARSLLCVCRPCYLLFTHDGAGGQRFRAVPDRFARVDTPATVLETLDIPIGVAFLFRNSASNKITAFYPSPAGPVESELAPEAWAEISNAAPALDTLAADVEALLIRQTDGRALDRRATHDQALIVPIDFCYELVGRVRQLWKGLHGGDEVWAEVDAAFAYAIDRSQESRP